MIVLEYNPLPFDKVLENRELLFLKKSMKKQKSASSSVLL